MSQISTERPDAPSAMPTIAKPVVLVGLMGAGKTAIGKRLAQRLGLPFIDADQEIETAAGATIEEIFERFGEPTFRAGERRVIQRLLEGAPHVLATGGGAFVDSETRARIRAGAISIWLKAELDVLLRRVARRNNRPLLKDGDPREVLERLMIERYPAYEEANIVVESLDGPPEATLERVIAALDDYLRAQSAT